MGANWCDCIVTYIDLVDATKDASIGVATRQMRQLHALVIKGLGGGVLSTVAQAYVWNDSVLVLSFVDEGKPHSYHTALRDICALKARIDELGTSYAIIVKGQPFPPTKGLAPDPRVTVLRTSSWAMANCFLIEKTLKQYRASWYLDSRVAGKVSTCKPFRKETMALLPKNHRRSIHLYKGRLLPEV